MTLDQGFGNTGSCESGITFINGEEGILRYRGYPIEQLAAEAKFPEVCWLLINGELPTGSELREPINRTLLRFSEDGTYRALLVKWFGPEASG